MRSFSIQSFRPCNFSSLHSSCILALFSLPFLEPREESGFEFLKICVLSEIYPDLNHPVLSLCIIEYHRSNHCGVWEHCWRSVIESHRREEYADIKHDSSISWNERFVRIARAYEAVLWHSHRDPVPDIERPRNYQRDSSEYVSKHLLSCEPQNYRCKAVSDQDRGEIDLEHCGECREKCDYGDYLEEISCAAAVSRTNVRLYNALDHCRNYPDHYIAAD